MSEQIVHIEDSDYNSMLLQAVAFIDEARASTAKSVSVIVNAAYWNIGKLLYERKLESVHGNRVVERLSMDLKQFFPKMGLSPHNLWDMKRFYERFCGGNEKLRQAVAVLPWSHNLLMLNKKLDDKQVLYYAHEVIAKGWSLNENGQRKFPR